MILFLTYFYISRLAILKYEFSDIRSAAQFRTLWAWVWCKLKERDLIDFNGLWKLTNQKHETGFKTWELNLVCLESISQPQWSYSDVQLLLAGRRQMSIEHWPHCRKIFTNESFYTNQSAKHAVNTQESEEYMALPTQPRTPFLLPWALRYIYLHLLQVIEF